MKHMRILILGVFHNQQPYERDADPSHLRCEKDALEQQIRNAILSCRVRFIGEESKRGIETIAKRIADQSDPQIPWVNIDMTDDEERATGIYEALKKRPFDTEFDEDGKPMRRYHRIPEDKTRENFFVEKTKNEAEKAETALVICGHCHVEALREKFTERGDLAEVVNS